jgi:hypothetical protein
MFMEVVIGKASGYGVGVVDGEERALVENGAMDC